jgi:glycerol uptake facilitator-like aquaporin
MARHRPVRHASREAIAVARGTTKTHYHLRRRILMIFGVTAVFAVICTLVTYFTEHNAQGTEIHSLFDAFLFATSQLLTGSSVANPATDLGKVLELVFDLWAIFVVASLAGSFGAFFHARSKELNEEMEKAERLLHHGTEGSTPGAAPAEGGAS